MKVMQMKIIDKLIIKAKKKCGEERLTLGFILPSETEPGKWIATGQIWNGIPHGKCRNIEFICNSFEEAENKLNKLVEQFPNDKDVVILIDN